MSHIYKNGGRVSNHVLMEMQWFEDCLAVDHWAMNYKPTVKVSKYRVRPRKLSTLIQRIGDKQLMAFWQLRCTVTSAADHKLVRDAILERINILRNS